MICASCGKETRYHWTGLCGLCDPDYTGTPKNLRMQDSLRRSAGKNPARRERDEEGVFASLGSGDAVTPKHIDFPTDQYGNVLDGGEKI